MTWKRRLTSDPIPKLRGSKNRALRYFTSRDLLSEEPGSVKELWELPQTKRLLGLQRENGAWTYHGRQRHIRSPEDYNQIETFRILRELVEKYGLDKNHPAFAKAAEFMFSHQTDEGDFRGIAGNQHLPYYSGAIMELLVKGGYAADRRIARGFNWLLSVRQDDGGWAIPLRTVGLKFSPEIFRSGTVEANRAKPSSQLVTGMVLRAFAAHPSYRRSRDAYAAGELLANRFFKPDAYPDRRAPSFWTSFSFPFWFTDLLSALDSLSQIGLNPSHPPVARALEWFSSRQQKTGLWRLRLRMMAREKEPDSWITLAISRVFKRFYG
jgi:hypothetical protein